MHGFPGFDWKMDVKIPFALILFPDCSTIKSICYMEACHADLYFGGGVNEAGMHNSQKHSVNTVGMDYAVMTES